MPMCRARMLFACLSVFVLMGATKCQKNHDEQVATANEMVEAFGQSCNMGPWSQASLKRVTEIAGIYQSLLNKQGCTGNPNVQSALNSAQALQSEIQTMQNISSAVGQERIWEETSNDLLVQINQTTDPNLQATLIAEYGTARYNLSEARANANYIQDPGYKQQMAYGFETINARVREILAASNSLVDCYNNNPGVAMQLGSSLAELGGAFAPPMVGMGISAISSLIKLAVDFSVKAPTAKAVYDQLAAKMPAALSCGLEALTRDYCKAKDARVLLDFSQKSKDGTLLPFFYGTDLQDRYMPTLYGWLDQVVNGGSSVRNPDHANLLNRQFGRLAVAQGSLRTAKGYLADTKQAILREPSSEPDRVRNLLKILVRIFYQKEGPFPGADDSSVFAGHEACDAFVGKLVRLPLSNENSLEQEINHLAVTAGDFTFLEDSFNNLFRLRFDQMMVDFNEKVQISAPLTVKAAFDRNFEGLSPILAWQRMNSFYDQYAFRTGVDGERDRLLLSEIRSSLQPVYDQLSDPRSVSGRCEQPPNPDPAKPAPACIPPSTQVLSVAHEVFKLEDNSNNYLPKVVGDFVHSDLVNRACRGETPKELKDVLRIGGQDLSLLMNRVGLNSPAAIKEDITRAQDMTIASLEQFRKFYMPAVKLVMRDLKERADRNKEPPPGSKDAPTRDQLSRLCILTYISGMDQKDLDYNLYCRDAQIQSLNDVSISLRDLIRTLEGKPLDQRVCAYEKFLRVDRLKNQDVPATMCQDGGPFRRATGMQSERYDADRQAKKNFWQAVLYSN